MATTAGVTPCSHLVLFVYVELNFLACQSPDSEGMVSLAGYDWNTTTLT